MATEPQIRILVAGGSIDGIDYSSEDKAPDSVRTNIPKMLVASHLMVPAVLEVILLKDSRFMTDADRDKIARHCVESGEKRIVVTHGTYSMAKTARRLATAVKGKTVVLTGARTPYSAKTSDALFNLGAAIAAVQLLAPGVYVCMHGRIFNWNNVVKNTLKDEFFTLSEMRKLRGERR